MPWSDNWDGGGGRGGPWGQGPGNSGGGGPRKPRRGQPDLDDVTRRVKERFKAPKGFKFGPIGVGLLVLVLAVVYLFTGIYQIEPGEVGVEQRFGEYTTTTGPGLNYHLPWPFERVTIINTELERRVEVGTGRGTQAQEESLMLTGDENIIDLTFTVIWRISSARDFTFNVRDPQDTVKPLAESVMREVIGRGSLDVIQTTRRAEVGLEAQRLLQEALDEYGAGIQINRLEIQDALPPPQVRDAFRDVQAAQQDAETARNQGLAYRNRVVPEARGQAARILAQANAYREQAVAEANGEAQRFVSILNEYTKAKEVTRRRMYYETMERVLGQGTKILIDEQGGSGVVPYLPLPEVARQQEQRRQQRETTQGGSN
jgi:membrane protease subunit HflK